MVSIRKEISQKKKNENSDGRAFEMYNYHQIYPTRWNAFIHFQVTVVSWMAASVSHPDSWTNNFKQLALTKHNGPLPTGVDDSMHR